MKRSSCVTSQFHMFWIGPGSHLIRGRTNVSFVSHSISTLSSRMGTFLGPNRVLMMLSAVVFLVCLVNSAEAEENCKKLNLPKWIDWRTEEAKKAPNRPRLTGWRTFVVVLIAVLTVLANALLCHLLLWDKNLWKQRTYRMIFSLAVNDCLTGLLLGIGVLTEMQSVQDSLGLENLLCKMVMAGLWFSATTSVYTFTVISVSRWLMLNHPKFYKKHFQERPIWTVYIGIAACWLAGACHAVPLLTSWNNTCVSDFTTCSLPYKSPLWIWGAALFVLFIPSLIIVVVYTLILLKIREENAQTQVAEQVTKTMSILTAAFLICWWPLGIYLSVKWNTVGGSRGFYLGALSSLANPVLLIFLNNQLWRKVADIFARLRCC